MAIKAKSKSSGNTRSSKAKATDSVAAAYSSRKRSSSSVSEPVDAVSSTKKRKMVVDAASIKSSSSRSSAAKASPSLKGKASKSSASTRSSANTTKPPIKKAVTVKKSVASTKRMPKPAVSSGSISKRSSKNGVSNGTISKKTKVVAKKGVSASKKPADKAAVLSKKSSRSKTSSSVNFRNENVSANQENALKQQETLRAQMSAGRSARALARGLPLESSESEGSDTEDSNTPSDAERSISSNGGHLRSSKNSPAGASSVVSTVAKALPAKKAAKEVKNASAKISPVLSSFSVKSKSAVNSFQAKKSKSADDDSDVSSVSMGSATFGAGSPSLMSTSSVMSSFASKGSPSIASMTVSKQKGQLEILPHIEVTDHSGVHHNLADLAKETGVVLFAYPKANTPGCSTQALSYSDNFGKFEDLGYTVYGISFDTPSANFGWKVKQNYAMKFLSSEKDEGVNALRALGANREATKIERSHWVFAKGGKLLNKVIGTKPATCVAVALEVAEDNPQK